MLPITAIMTKITTKERIKPAIAMPRGALNKPIVENIRPKNHRIKSTKGTQQKTSPNKAIIKPAMPMLFD